MCVLVFVAEMLNADNVPALVNIECMRCTQSQSGALLLCDANGGRAGERESELSYKYRVDTTASQMRLIT